MKASLLAFLIFFSCFSFVSAQKKYLAKIQTLDGKWHKGVLMKVDSNGIYALSKKMGWNSKDSKVNLKKAKFFNFREIKLIKIRRKNSTDKGMIIGASIGLTIGIVAAKTVIRNFDRNRQPDNTGVQPFSSSGFNAFGAYINLVPLGVGGGGALGSIIAGHYPNKYKIDNRSSNFKDLVTELKKYEWYPTDEGVVK